MKTTSSAPAPDRCQADTNQILSDAMALAQAAFDRGADPAVVVLGLVSAAVAVAKDSGRSVEVVKRAAEFADAAMVRVPADLSDNDTKNQGN